MQRNWQVYLLLVVLLAACVPAGAGTPSAAPTGGSAPSSPAVDTSIEVTDALGRQVVLPAPPQRIVITGKALFMLADAAYLFPGAAQKIVGLGNAGQGSSNFIRLIDPAYEQKAVLANEAGAEQVAALQPDLVILKSYLAESVGAPIEALGIPVIYIDFETPEQYRRDLVILGQVFGDKQRAAEVVAFYDEKTEFVRQAVADVPRPRALLLYYNDKDGSVAFNVPPLDWMQTQMLEIAGGEPVWADANPGKGWAQVTLEQVAAWNAEHIFVIAYNQDSASVVAALRDDPQWQALRAVRTGGLHAFPADLYSWDQPDPRWILGLTWLSGRLHPERFPNLDMLQEARAFYQMLYGLDAAFFDENIRPAFKGDLP